jgi:hypothetical protein
MSTKDVNNERDDTSEETSHNSFTGVQIYGNIGATRRERGNRSSTIIPECEVCEISKSMLWRSDGVQVTIAILCGPFPIVDVVSVLDLCPFEGFADLVRCCKDVKLRQKNTCFQIRLKSKKW